MSDITPVQQAVVASQDTSITLRDVVYIVFRRRWIVVAITVPIMIIASLGLFRQEGSFVASCKVLMELRGIQDSRWNPSTAHIDEDRELSTFEHMAMSIPVATIAAEQIQDSLRTLIRRDPNLDGLGRKRKLIKYIQENLDVSVMGESNIFDIQFGSPNVDFSLLAVEAVRDAFMHYSVFAVKNSRAVEYYEEQIHVVRGQIDSLLALRAAIHQETGYVSLEDDLRYETGQLAMLRKEHFDAIADRTYLEAKVRQLRQARRENPGFFPVSEKEMESLPLNSAKQRVDRYRDELNTMLSTYPESSVQIQRQREKVERAEEILQTALDDYLRGFEVLLQAAVQLENVRREQIAEMEASLQGAPDAYHRISLVDTELSTKSQLLESMQVKSGEVRLNEMADERVSRLIKLTEPEIVMVGTGGKMFAYFALVSVFGFLFSIVVAFAIDRQDHRLYTPRSVEEHLEVPILGVISDIKSEIKS